MADSIGWDVDAKALLEAICAELPFFIRAQARTATQQKAEELARQGAQKSVTRDGVVEATISITPPPMKGQLKALLAKCGVDLARWADHLR